MSLSPFFRGAALAIGLGWTALGVGITAQALADVPKTPDVVACMESNAHGKDCPVSQAAAVTRHEKASGQAAAGAFVFGVGIFYLQRNRKRQPGILGTRT